MTPHIQTETAEGIGSCFATCIACILDLPVDSVPNFMRLQHENELYDMTVEADKWLRVNHGKRFISIELYEQEEGPDKGSPLTRQCTLNRLYFANNDELVILSGESPRKRADGRKRYHCVVGKADCWGYEIVHDPHPAGGGIIGQPYGVKWIVLC